MSPLNCLSNELGDQMNQSITSQLSDEAIHQILEIIASEIDGIDDKEFNIEFLD